MSILAIILIVFSVVNVVAHLFRFLFIDRGADTILFRIVCITLWSSMAFYVAINEHWIFFTVKAGVVK